MQVVKTWAKARGINDAFSGTLNSMGYILLLLHVSLQCTVTHCSILQHTATHCNTLQRTATHSNAQQRTAMHCNALQHTATH